MKALLGSLTLVLALGLATANVMSADAPKDGAKKKAYTEGSCCAKATKKGETCKHPCCVAAEKEGKVCVKCNKPKEEKK